MAEQEQKAENKLTENVEKTIEKQTEQEQEKAEIKDNKKFEKIKEDKNKGLREEIEVPEGVTASFENPTLIMKKDDVELKRDIAPLINIKIERNKIILETKKTTKKERKLFGTFKAHIKNMVTGLTEGFQYKLQVESVHFPITVTIDKEKNELVVKNFLGEKTDRRIKLVPNVEIKIDKDIIEIEGKDKELAGQCAANLEKGTFVRNKDRRIYQDGIYIIEKPGRKFL